MRGTMMRSSPWKKVARIACASNGMRSGMARWNRPNVRSAT
jgi:hypothetical protein